jgi:hypothetical protein
MTFKLFKIVTLFVGILFLNSCSKDETSPKLQFVSEDGETYSLKGANLFLTGSGTVENTDYKHYIITDGISYTNGTGHGGWDLGDFNESTYYLGVELRMPGGTDFGPGNFPQFDAWNTMSSWMQLETGTENNKVQYYTSYEDETSAVKVSGGFADNDTMTFKFSGTLWYSYYNGSNWVEEGVTGKFYFTGKVQDVRPL